MSILIVSFISHSNPARLVDRNEGAHFKDEATEAQKGDLSTRTQLWPGLKPHGPNSQLFPVSMWPSTPQRVQGAPRGAIRLSVGCGLRHHSGKSFNLSRPRAPHQWPLFLSLPPRSCHEDDVGRSCDEPAVLISARPGTRAPQPVWRGYAAPTKKESTVWSLPQAICVTFRSVQATLDL